MDSTPITAWAPGVALADGFAHKIQCQVAGSSLLLPLRWMAAAVGAVAAAAAVVGIAAAAVVGGLALINPLEHEKAWEVVVAANW